MATIGIDVRLLIDGGHVIFQNIDPKNYRGKFGLLIEKILYFNIVLRIMTKGIYTLPLVTRIKRFCKT